MARFKHIINESIFRIVNCYKMPKVSNKKKSVSPPPPPVKSSDEEETSGEENEKEENEEDDSENDVPDDRDSSDSDEEIEPDIRNQFLLPMFRPKPVQSVVSAFVKETLRAPLLGRPLLKEERRQLVEKYYCADADYKEFSAPMIHGK